MPIILFVFLVLQSPTGKAQSERKPALQLVLSPVEVTVVSGQEVALGLEVTNTSKQDADCTELYDGNVNQRYRYDIRKENGESLKQLHHSVKVIHNGGCTIKPGQTYDDPMPNLMSAFGMQEPGVYIVQVSAPDEIANRWVRSNTVKVIVKAPQ